MSTLEPLVTVVVTPRERFSCAAASLESIYEHTQVPFDLVYIDGNSPPHVRRYLDHKAHDKGFKIVRTNYYLSPNRARNLGVAHVKTPYLVFVDNDVIVSPGWLKALVTCADETGATVVGPLMCQDEPVHETIHFAGGESRVVVDIKGRRHLREKMYKQGHRVSDMRDRFQRRQTELAEFHCVLVRAAIFSKIGRLDEAMLNTKEHLDFCMTVAQTGGTVYFEPASIVTYVPGPPLDWSDVPYYMLRWSDAWTLGSLNHLRQKWDLSEDGYFKAKYNKLGWRRRATILRPLSRALTFGIRSHYLEKLLRPVERVFNRYLTDRYARRYLTQEQSQPAETPQSNTPATPVSG